MDRSPWIWTGRPSTARAVSRAATYQITLCGKPIAGQMKLLIRHPVALWSDDHVTIDPSSTATSDVTKPHLGTGAREVPAGAVRIARVVAIFALRSGGHLAPVRPRVEILQPEDRPSPSEDLDPVGPVFVALGGVADENSSRRRCRDGAGYEERHYDDSSQSNTHSLHPLRSNVQPVAVDDVAAVLPHQPPGSHWVRAATEEETDPGRLASTSCRLAQTPFVPMRGAKAEAVMDVCLALRDEDCAEAVPHNARAIGPRRALVGVAGRECPIRVRNRTSRHDARRQAQQHDREHERDPDPADRLMRPREQWASSWDSGTWSNPKPGEKPLSSPASQHRGEGDRPGGAFPNDRRRTRSYLTWAYLMSTESA